MAFQRLTKREQERVNRLKVNSSYGKGKGVSVDRQGRTVTEMDRVSAYPKLSPKDRQKAIEALNDSDAPKEKRVRSKTQTVSWHSSEKQLRPCDRMVRELHLMGIVIRRDWMSDDTTLAQDEELSRISESMRKLAKRLHRVFSGKH
jgi:hypothetical protein